MGFTAEITEPTTRIEKHQPVEDEQFVELERKTHVKRLDSMDTSTITTRSSSSFSGDGAEGEHLESPESPEQETEIGFHVEDVEGNKRNVYFDGEQGFESAGSELEEVHESQTTDHLNGEKKQSESENGSTSKDNKGTREIEEVQDTVNQEELEIGDVEEYDVEKVLDNQETHDLFCPNCNSCITKKVVLKRRKRKIPHVLEDPKRLRGSYQSDTLLHSEDNLPSVDDVENSRRQSFVYKCFSCLNIFIHTGEDTKPVHLSQGSEGLKIHPKPQEEAAGDSNWFSSIFGFKKKETAVQQDGAMPSVPEASLPRDSPNLLVEDKIESIANSPSEAPALVQDGAATSFQDLSEISASQDNKPVGTTLIQVSNSHDTSKGVNNGAIGATVEDNQTFLALSAREKTQQNIDKDDDSEADGSHLSDKGRLSPIQPPHEMNISNIVTSGPDGVRVETIIHTEGVSHLFEGTDTRIPDFGLTKVTGEREVITNLAIPGVEDLPVSSLEEGTLREPLFRPVSEQLVRPVVEGRKLEIMKSIVYGGLIESITSLGVISSAAGSGASTLNILVLGLANLFGGLILMIHNLQELREEKPRRITSEENQSSIQEEGQYKRLLGRRENFTLHASVAILSFIITGLIPPIVYYFSFSKTHNRDYKVASVFGASLLCIIFLAIAKAHVKSPRGSHLKSVLYYATIAVSVSGISYVVGNFVDQFLEKYGWSDGSETPAREMMLSLMGRKAGSFGYSSSY